MTSKETQDAEGCEESELQNEVKAWDWDEIDAWDDALAREQELAIIWDESIKAAEKSEKGRE